MKKFLALFSVLAFSFLSEAQDTYIIRFTDKGSNPFSLSDPGEYLSQRAIDRRLRYSIPLDSTDLPVTPRYIDSIKLSGTVTILNVSRWLNSISIHTTDASAVTKFNSFAFVQAVVPIAPRPVINNSYNKFRNIENENGWVSSEKPFEINEDHFDYGNSFNQVHIHNGEFLHNIGLRGENMMISMIDAGFQNYLSVSSLDSVHDNGQILGTWDFVAGHASVNEDNSHGMQCFSTIAANLPGQFVGTAPKALFHLFRSENASTEFPIEEFNWVCAAERADSVGGDVISSSLGYNTFDAPFTAFNHTYAHMDGNTALPTIGGDLAAKKGILVINSAGNEGTSSWHFIVTPADGDSVMAVGAVNAAGNPVSFSSYGPTADGRIKPDVASVGAGTIVQFPNNSIGPNNGTSFSAPNMAGLTTCLWQGFQEFNNMKIIDALRNAGSISSTPDDRIGYGIPDVKVAVMDLIKEFATFNASLSNCTTTLEWTSKDMNAMRYEIERMLPGETAFTKIADQQGNGEVFGTKSYQYNDDLFSFPAGTVAYRIRQVIDTSAAGLLAGYLDTVTIQIPPSCNPSSITESVVLLPNPTRNDLTVRITTPTSIPHLTIHIYNTKGQLMVTMKANAVTGTTAYDISEVGFLAAGKYYVTVYDGPRLMATRELIKL